MTDLRRRNKSLFPRRNLHGDEKMWDMSGPKYPGLIHMLQTAAASMCIPITSKLTAWHQPIYACHSLISCSASMLKQGNDDCRLLRFPLNLPAFCNIHLSSFKCFPEGVEHQWMCCCYIRELQVVFFRFRPSLS